MKVTYDEEVDIMRIVFSEQAIEESDEEKPGLIFDYSKQGKIVSMEILEASKITAPALVQFEVTKRGKNINT